MKNFYPILIIVCLLIYKPSFAQFAKLHDFDYSSDGLDADGSLISDGTFLYGMTSQGGVKGDGIIFKIMPNGTGYTKLFDFSDSISGSRPRGDLVADGTFLYGMTPWGGINDAGTIFKIKLDGSGYLKLLDFTDSINGTVPFGSLISDGAFLYGVAHAGGTNGYGTVFKIKHDGTAFEKLRNFAGGADGAQPYGTLVSDGIFLYGMTFAGGINNDGIIFKIKPDGSDYSKLFDFTDSLSGRHTEGSLLFDGMFLYGMTFSGGINDLGTIFKIKTDGTGYAKLLDFAGIANGSNPLGSLISDGTYLYGMTCSGGTPNIYNVVFGTLFKIKPDGTDYAKLFNFSTIGGSPLGSLLSDGTFFYGTTRGGGTYNLGVIFKFGINIGVEEINENNNITVCPNPSTRQANIQIPKQFGQPKTLEVFDYVGQLQLSKTNNFADIDISCLTNGLYFIVLTNLDNERLVSKIIKE